MRWTEPIRPPPGPPAAAPSNRRSPNRRGRDRGGAAGRGIRDRRQLGRPARAAPGGCAGGHGGLHPSGAVRVSGSGADKAESGGSGRNARLSRATPWLWVGVALLLTALASAAVGAVPIPPVTAARILLARLPALHIRADRPAPHATILYEIRLPNLALTALPGMALAGRGGGLP